MRSGVTASSNDDMRVLEIHHPDSAPRRVPARLGPLWFGAGQAQCLYAGDTQGGLVYEVESPNDSLIEGSYKEYIISSIFGRDFKFNRFEHSHCSY